MNGATLLAHEFEIVRAAERPALARGLAVGGAQWIVVVQEDVRIVHLFAGEHVIRRRKPARALPAKDRTEHCPAGCHAIVTRRALQRTRRGALLVRIVNGEDIGVGLLGLGLEIAAGRIGAEAAWIHSQHVDGWLAIDNPLGKLPARTASCCHAEGMALVQPEIR